MKKNILIIGLAFFTTSIFSQNSTIQYGVKGGLNYSKYNISSDIVDSDIFKGKVGFYLGGFVNFEFSDRIKLQPELLFASQGTNTSTEFELRPPAEQEPVVGEFKTRINESTILLPIMLKLYPSENFYIELGPQLGYIIARKEKVTEDPFTELGSPFGVIEDCPNCDKFDFGAALGLGYNFTDKIGINARYFAGLIERNNIIKSSVINLGVNYKL